MFSHTGTLLLPEVICLLFRVGEFWTLPADIPSKLSHVFLPVILSSLACGLSQMGDRVSCLGPGDC